MPSRINMGPDGGPYIAINENNGNIELEDNTGTTVAIWDDANSQWDFQNNPISNVDSLTSNSVNTEDGTIDGYPFARGLGESVSDTTVAAGQQEIPSDSFGTVFDVSEAVNIIAGNAFGPSPSNVRVTYDGGATEDFGGGTESNITGDINDGSSFFGVAPIPPVDDITKLEVYNDGGTAKDYGWFIIHT